MDLCDRLTSPNWQVEWGLPRWLGESRGLPEATCARLVEANVFGLGYIRLTDDDQDGQAATLGAESTRQLAERLYAAAISVYQGLIGPNPWFWGQLERYLAEWRSTGPESLQLNALRATDSELQSLARVGSPLLISVAAVCALARQEDQLARLEAPVRRYLVATVLVDHMSDWQEDLQGGRPNLFVQALLRERPQPTRIDETRLRMAEAMLRPEGAAAYLELAVVQLRAAMSDSEREAVDGLTQTLVRLQERTREASDQLVGGVHSQLRKAADMLFSPSAVGGPAGRHES